MVIVVVVVVVAVVVVVLKNFISIKFREAVHTLVATNSKEQEKEKQKIPVQMNTITPQWNTIKTSLRIH